MAGVLTTALNSLRNRPAHERRVLAAITYVTLAVVVITIAITSLEQTLAPVAELSPPAGMETAQTENNGTSATPTASEPAAPLAILKETFSQAIRESRSLVTELRRIGDLTAGPEQQPATETVYGGSETTAPTPFPPVPTAAATAAEPQRPVAKIPAGEVEKTSPAHLIAEARTSQPYSAYATSRLLSTPLDAPVRMQAQKRQMNFGLAGMDTGTSRMASVIAYNLGELKRTASDIYEYFTQ